MVKDPAYVAERIAQLTRENSDTADARWRIRSIMNGGVDGILAVMLWDKGKGGSMSRAEALSSLGTDLPTVNLLHSGLERLAQMVGRMPTLKPPNADDDAASKRNQRRTDIVEQWDRDQRLELVYPQLGRWLPGYGFSMAVISQDRNDWGEWYPKAVIRDPYDVYTGYFGPDQQPPDAVAVRVAPLYAVEKAYPDQDWPNLEARLRATRPDTNRPTFVGDTAVYSDRQRGWEGPHTGIKVCEYLCDDGRYIVVPELEITLAVIPNVLDSPPFVFAKRFAFDKLISHYEHTIGLMSQLAKLNILGLIASEESVFRETNIVGEMIGDTYERGRFAVNRFMPGTVIDRPTGDQAQQIWAQMDRMERQIRIGANYDVQQDGTSPNSFATGQGMRELQTAAANNVREYQLVLQHFTERLDAKRLEFADKMYGRSQRRFFDMRGKETSYRPAEAIKGDYRTRRIYGAMATFDDQLKVVVGLQLLQGGVIDVETLQENIDGLYDLPLIKERNDRRQAVDVLYQRLAARGEMDPRADAALARIISNPADKEKILMEYFAPEPVEAEAEMQPPMAFPPQPPGAMGDLGAPPEQFATVLSRLEEGGGEMGVQTVGALNR